MVSSSNIGILLKLLRIWFIGRVISYPGVDQELMVGMT